MHPKGLQIVAVNYGDSAQIIQKYVKQGKFTFPIVLNGAGKTDVAAKFGVQAYPTNIVVDRSGKVRAALVGFDEAKLKTVLAKLGVK